MPKATQRHVSFFDLHVRATPEGGPARPIAQLAPFLIERAKSGRASADYAKGDLCYWIQDAEISDAGKSLLLLIHVADKLASDAAFANPEERTIRYARKRINEGRNWSAHLIISLTPQADNPRSYLALLEDIPGLSHHRVQLLLNKVFSYIAEEHEAQFQYPHPDGSKKDGKPRQRKFRPLVEFRGHLSNTFAEDLAVGKLQGIDLVTARGQAAAWDQTGYIREKARTVKLAVDQKNFIGSAMDLVLGALSKAAARKYEKARIRFKSSDKLNRTVEVDTATVTTDDIAYLKREVIDGFDGVLADSCQNIHDQMRARLRGMLIANRDRVEDAEENVRAPVPINETARVLGDPAPPEVAVRLVAAGS